LKQLFTQNSPEARSAQANAIYHYADALDMCTNPGDAATFSQTQRLACQAGAVRRGISLAHGIEFLSLPLLLERWQQESITLFSVSQHGTPLDLRASALVVELISSSPILMTEACELALAGLALDWQVQLLLSEPAATSLRKSQNLSHAKAFASLALFGLLEAETLAGNTCALDAETVLPVRQISSALYAERLAQPGRISL
jgi:hypothetical protein